MVRPFFFIPRHMATDFIERKRGIGVRDEFDQSLFSLLPSCKCAGWAQNTCLRLRDTQPWPVTIIPRNLGLGTGRVSVLELGCAILTKDSRNLRLNCSAY